MPLWLDIYILGSFATIAYGVWLHKENQYVDAAMFLFIIFIAIFSWVGLLALFVGYNAKRNR